MTRDSPTQLADVIYHTTEAPLTTLMGAQAYRLIGVGLSNLVASDAGAEQGGADLFDADAPKRAKAERAVDAIRDKFGTDAVDKGRTWRIRDPRQS